MGKFRDQADRVPRAEAVRRGAGLGDLVALLMLVGGAVAIAGVVDINGLLARWSAAPGGWLLNQIWALLVSLTAAFAVVARRRRGRIRDEVARREAVERRLADLAAASSEWQWEIDAEQHLVMVSEQAPSVLVELARGRVPWRPGGPLLEDEAWVRHRADLVRGRPVRDFRFRLVVADGSERHLQINGFPVRDDDGTLLGFRGTGIDVTGTALAQARARHLASHDALTDLANRAGLLDRLEQALARARAGGEQAALLCLDLDRFSELNDTLGHAAGDRILKRCAERLRTCIEAGDVLARTGGDEFAILQQRVDQPAGADAICRRLAEAMALPCEVDGESLILTASIGVVLIPGDGASADDLIKHADIALHRAKSAGRGSCCFFEPDMDAELWRRKATEADLWRALAQGEFDLHYQPQLAAETRAVTGLEALLRWHHPEQGLILPADFLGIAEETDLMMPLCGFVLREACQRAAAWPGIRMSVNLSPAQFLHRELTSLIEQALDASGLEPDRLMLEISEGALLRDSRIACEILDRLKQLGVRIAIDDFGTGYSSLSYLQKFDKIKIARSFTGAVGREDGTDAMIDAIMGLGRMLGLAVCAEGVETPEQRDWLRERGCAELQGFHFSAPLEVGEVEALLRGAADAEAAAKLPQVEAVA
jgi:diguanylate cyclase (GGDEF)-like protein